MKRVKNLYSHQFETDNIICPHGESYYCKECLEKYNPPDNIDADISIYDPDKREML